MKFSESLLSSLHPFGSNLKNIYLRKKSWCSLAFKRTIFQRKFFKIFLPTTFLPIVLKSVQLWTVIASFHTQKHLDT